MFNIFHLTLIITIVIVFFYTLKSFSKRRKHKKYNYKEEYKSDDRTQKYEDVEEVNNVKYIGGGERGMSTSPSMHNSADHHVIDINSYVSIESSKNASSPNNTSPQNLCNHNDERVYTGYKMRPADPKLYGQYRGAADFPKFSKDFSGNIDNTNINSMKAIKDDISYINHNIRANGVAVGRQGVIDFNEFKNDKS